jgi:hypothetical protein
MQKLRRAVNLHDNFFEVGLCVFDFSNFLEVGARVEEIDDALRGHTLPHLRVSVSGYAIVTWRRRSFDEASDLGWPWLVTWEQGSMWKAF